MCESSPIELHVGAYGQWSLSPPRDLAALQPPLPIDNPLMLSVLSADSKRSMIYGAKAGAALEVGADDGEEDKWLSQVKLTQALNNS